VVAVLLGLAAVARLGFITQFLSKPVMDGFVLGLAVFVVVGQLNKLFGVSKGEGNTLEKLGHILGELPSANTATVLVSIAALAVLFGLPRSSAMGIVLVSFSEALGVAREFAAKHGYEIDANRELTAHGAKNFVSGLFGGMIAASSAAHQVSPASTRTSSGTQIRHRCPAFSFTDLVGSTERAAELGDARWRAVLERHGEVTRSELFRFRGREVKSIGDGFLATFEGPARAIRCAEAIRTAVRGLGMEIRAGIHAGECEVMGDDVGGIAVHIAARVNAVARTGEILVSRTVRDLVVGSGIAFEERGTQTLKGVPGEWSLLAVVPEGAAQESPEVTITKIETPSPRETMRRSDRIAAAVARRAPGVLRAASRLEARRRLRQAT